MARGLPAALPLWPQVCAGLVLLSGATALTGWALHVDALTRILPQWPQMVPNTALGVMLCGLALGLAPQRRLAPAVRLAGGAAGLLGALTLAEYALGVDLGLDGRLFGAALADHGVVRMSVATALCLTLGGLVLALHPDLRLRRFTEYLLHAVGGLAFLRFVGYPFGVDHLRILRGFQTMPVLTSGAFLLIWAGTAAARGRSGLLGLVLSPYSGGRTARWLLPLGMAVPLLNAWLRQCGEGAGWFTHEEGAMLVVTANAALVAVLVLSATRALNRIDIRRAAQDEALRRNEARLKRLFDSPMMGVFTWSRDGWVTGANDQFLHMLGFTREDIATGWMSWSKEMPDRRGTPVTDGAGVVTAYATELSRADGTPLPVVLGAVYPDAELDEGVGFILDDFARRRAQEQVEERNAELEQLNDELDRSQARLRRLFDSPMLGVFYWGLDGRITEGNQRFLDMLGYTAADVAAGRLNWPELTPPEYDAIEAQKIQEILATGAHSPYENEFIRADGSRLPVVVGAALLDARAREGVAFVLDNSGRKQAQEQLAERNAELEQVNAELALSEQRLRHVIDSPLIGITFWRLQDGLPVLTDANDRFIAMLGYTREDLVQGRLTWERVSTREEDQQLRERNNRQFAETGRIAPYEREYVRADGSRLPVLVGAVLLDAATQAGVSFVLDITEQRGQREQIEERNAELEQLANELARNEAKLRAVFESPLTAMFYWNLDGTVLEANARFSELTGYSAEDIAARRVNYGQLAGPQNQAQFEARRAAIREAGALGVTELVIMRADGQTVPVMVSSLLLDKTRQEGVSVMLDISEQHAARAAVEERNTALEQLYEELATSENRLRRIFESPLMGMVLWKMDGSILNANRRFYDMVGYVPSDIGRGRLTWDALLAPESAERRESQRSQLVASGETVPLERELVRSDGRPIQVMFGSALFDVQAQEGVSYVLDITEQARQREQIEERNAELEQLYNELASSEQRLRAVFESSLIGKFFWRLDGAITEANRHFLQTTGYSAEQIAAGELTWRGLRPPEDTSHIVAEGRAIKETGELAPKEIEIVRADGSRLPVLIGAVLLDAEQMAGVGFMLDVSAQHAARELLEQRGAELQRSEARLRALFDSPLSAMAFSTQDGVITEANSRFLELTGAAEDAIRGRRLTWNDLTPPELRARQREQSGRIQELGVIVPEEDILYRTDGERVPVLAGGALLPGSQQEWVAFILDISEQVRQREMIEERKAELEQLNAELEGRTAEVERLAADLQARNELLEQLREAAQAANVQLTLANSDLAANNERLVQLEHEARDSAAQLSTRAAELQRTNAELDSFSYSVSHDLRAPLRAIEGFSRALEEDYAEGLDADAQRYIGRIRAGTLRMAQLIDDLLQLSRVSRAELNLGMVDLTEIARVVAGLLNESTPEREVAWEIELGMTGHCDGRMLRIVLDNLLGNAFKFSGKRHQARISFSRVETKHGRAYCVRDNGAGFEMEYADKLFTAFQRLHSAEEFTGTGIGLSIVRRIISRHGGEIWAESTPGEGAAFYFTLSATGEGQADI
jgi:PAS domain S-box-containing protein